MSDELLSFERYAEVLAHLQHFGDPNGREVRRRLDVGDEVWERSQKHWVDVLYKDTSASKPILAISFAQLYGGVSTRLAAEQPTIESIGDSDAAPASAADVRSGTSDAPPPPSVIGPQGPAAAPTPATTAAPAPSDRLSPWAKPHLAGSSPVKPPPVSLQERLEAPAAVVAPPAPPLAGPTVPTSVDETAYAAVVITDDPLPFTQHAKEDIGAKLAANVALSTRMGGLTGEIPAILSDGNETLPFLDVSQLQLDDDIRERFTLEQYASFCAEITVNPARRTQTTQRYGIDEASVDKLREAWDNHFATSHSDKHRFDELFMRYRTWLSENR